jgi:hypothetical protein
MRFSLIRLLLGRPLANREYGGRKVGAFEGVPAMGLDGLGSSAYGPEAALTALIPLGAAGLSLIGWVMAPILGLLGILFASYWQTIRAYPSNGGAYIVSKENLGTNHRRHEVQRGCLDHHRDHSAGDPSYPGI